MKMEERSIILAIKMRLGRRRTLRTLGKQCSRKPGLPLCTPYYDRTIEARLLIRVLREMRGKRTFIEVS